MIHRHQLISGWTILTIPDHPLCFPGKIEVSCQTNLCYLWGFDKSFENCSLFCRHWQIWKLTQDIGKKQEAYTSLAWNKIQTMLLCTRPGLWGNGNGEDILMLENCFLQHENLVDLMPLFLLLGHLQRYTCFSEISIKRKVEFFQEIWSHL